MTITIAHRGYRQVTPENTLAAFEAAVRAGANMIETDIHVCQSGEIVIMHDDDVSATSNGTGKISELTLTELKQLDLGSWFSPAFSGQRIVTLRELVEFYGQHPDLKLLLEFKGEWSMEQCQQALAELAAGDLKDRTILESFDVNTLAALREVASDYNRGLLIEYAVDDPTKTAMLLELCEQLGVMSLNPPVDVTQANPELVQQCHQANLQVMVWTANEPAEFQFLTDLGVDGICTDRIGFLNGWLAAAVANQE